MAPCIKLISSYGAGDTPTNNGPNIGDSEYLNSLYLPVLEPERGEIM